MWKSFWKSCCWWWLPVLTTRVQFATLCLALMTNCVESCLVQTILNSVGFWAQANNLQKLMLINLFFQFLQQDSSVRGSYTTIYYQIHGELVAVLLLLSFTRLMCVGSNMNLKRTTTTSARGQATQQNFSAKEAKSQFVPCQPFSDKTTGDEGISFTF